MSELDNTRKQRHGKLNQNRVSPLIVCVYIYIHVSSVMFVIT